MPGVDLELENFSSDVPPVSGVSDANGEFNADLPVGQVSVRAPALFVSGGVQLQRKDTPVLLDMFSTEQCTVSGAIYDQRGLPLENAALEFSTGFSFSDPLVSTNTNLDGEFTFSAGPGRLALTTVNGFNNPLLSLVSPGKSIDNCRPVGGQPPEVRLDLQINLDILMSAQ